MNGQDTPTPDGEDCDAALKKMKVEKGQLKEERLARRLFEGPDKPKSKTHFIANSSIS